MSHNLSNTHCGSNKSNQNKKVRFDGRRVNGFPQSKKNFK